MGDHDTPDHIGHRVDNLGHTDHRLDTLVHSGPLEELLLLAEAAQHLFLDIPGPWEQIPAL